MPGSTRSFKADTDVAERVDGIGFDTSKRGADPAGSPPPHYPSQRSILHVVAWTLPPLAFLAVLAFYGV